jgi:hypothetical protein
MMLLQECKVYCSPIIVSSQTSRSINLKIILQIVLCEYLLSIVPVLTMEGEGKKNRPSYRGAISLVYSRRMYSN